MSSSNVFWAVNQAGYLIDGPKVAVLVINDAAPLPWQILGPGDVVLAKGNTTVHGVDKASGLPCHHADFSYFRTEGRDFVLLAPSRSIRSMPFSIGTGLYTDAAREALRYFYLNRSGMDIAMPRAGTESQCRKGGHMPDLATAPETTGGGQVDVSGGWYDAGDHGKYVVNGGVALWTLQNLIEHSLGDEGILPGPLDLGELLDECRWELEFMMRMQVPQGRPLAGMAWHKVNDAAWTPIPTAPADDAQARMLFGPSTAATYNLAAVCAQGYRVWRVRDKPLAARLLLAAYRAWEAAEANPVLLAKAEDPQGGGGAYGDSHVEDEHYWAACELYAATKEQRFAVAIEHSPYSRKAGCLAMGEVRDTGRMAFDWQTTNSLGTMTLACLHIRGGEDWQEESREAIIAVARTYLKQLRTEGFLVPLLPEAYPWGSNSFVLNKMIMMALAYDFSGDRFFRDGVLLSLDYLFGRNALSLSYVTGVGTRAAENPHHRFWAHQADARYPKAPAGCLVGGPDSEVVDPRGEIAGLRALPPQRCYVDHIESYASNEVAINWNAPLVWMLHWVETRLV